MRSTVALALLLATGFLAFSIATAQISPPRPTGADRICINRCEAKGWPKQCLADCLRRWR